MKYIYLIILFFNFSHFSFSQSGMHRHTKEVPNKNVTQPGRTAAPSPAVFSHVEFEPSVCISEDIRRQTKETIQKNKQKILDKDPNAFSQNRSDHPLFIWPIQPKEGFNDYGYYTVNFLVDHNALPNNNLTDYNCGSRTYDWVNGNHEGTDLILWPYPWKRMAEEVMEIVAAAPGIITDKRDGHFDGNCSNNGNPNWNGIVLEHADGSESWYWHFKNGAITTKEIGESVEAGEYLGAAGSSGSSNWPHLHFEVYDSQGNLIDPFVGECNQMNEVSWWQEQQNYFESQINHISTHYTTDFDNNCPEPENTYEQVDFEPGDDIILRIFYKDLQELALTDITIFQPNGTAYMNWTFENPWGFYATADAYWILETNENWPQGEYIFQAVFDDETYQTTFGIGTTSGIKEDFAADLNLFPVPANYQFHLTGIPTANGISKIKVYNFLGELVITLQSTTDHVTISTEQLSSGLYFLELEQGERKAVRKFSVNR